MTYCPHCDNTGFKVRYHDGQRVVIPCRHRPLSAPRITRRLLTTVCGNADQTAGAAAHAVAGAE